MSKRANVLERTQGLTMVESKRQIAQTFWTPISCLLARAAYRSLAECQAFRTLGRTAADAAFPALQ